MVFGYIPPGGCDGDEDIDAGVVDVVEAVGGGMCQGSGDVYQPVR